MKHYVIIVAGGSGSRMNAEIPKQFLLLAGKPVLMHTLQAFYQSEFNPEIILVLNDLHVELWANLCGQYQFNIPHTIAKNGRERFHSVKNGLNLTDDNSIIAVHDAVRPLVSSELITRLFRLAADKKAVIPLVLSKDSVRMKKGGTTVSLNRQDIFLVQTPQVFEAALLKKAYLQPYQPSFTDDASVVEAFGAEIFSTEGDYRNIKITYVEDLELAEISLRKRT